MTSNNNLKNNNPDKERLLKTLEFLEKQNLGPHAYKILDALANGLFWTEESKNKVTVLGKNIAQELYDEFAQNFEYEFYLNDPNNPRNWDKNL